MSFVVGVFTVAVVPVAAKSIITVIFITITIMHTVIVIVIVATSITLTILSCVQAHILQISEQPQQERASENSLQASRSEAGTASRSVVLTNMFPITVRRRAEAKFPPAYNRISSEHWRKERG